MSQHSTSGGGDEQTPDMTPKQLQQSFLEQMESFERDDDLTVVTTAESIGEKNRNNDFVNNSAPSSPPENIAKPSFKFNQGSLGDVGGSAIDSRFASMSIQEREQATHVECIAAPKSSLAIAASRQPPSDQRYVSSLTQNKPSSLSSTISTNLSGYQSLAPPPPGFVSPISLKSERNNVSNSDHFYQINRDRAFFTDSRVIRRKEGKHRGPNERHPIQKLNQRSTFQSNNFWGTMHDDTSSMPSATIVSSNSHSTVSDAASLVGTWKNSNLRQSQNNRTFQGQYGHTQSSLGSYNNSTAVRFNRPNSMKDSSSVSTSFHSLSNESYYQRSNVNSHAVQSILSSPSTLFQTQGLYNVELAQSSSSNSSSFSEHNEAIPSTDTSPGFKFTSNSEANLSYALPPLSPVKLSQGKILPEISKQLSSSGSGDQAYCKKEDVFRISRSSQSSSGQSPKSKKREWRLKMSRKLAETPVGELNPDDVPLIALMNVSLFTMVETHTHESSSNNFLHGNFL